MGHLWNKLILLLSCFVLIATTKNYTAMIVSLLVSIAFSCFISIFSKQNRTLFFLAAFFILCLIYPQFLYFAPLLCYDLFAEKLQGFCGILFLPLLLYSTVFPVHILLILFLMAAISYLLKWQYKNVSALKDNYSKLRDTSVEMTEQLAKKNEELLEKQDYEINLATLNERNRIAKEIHDNVGHLLSSSILQIGAILATTEDDEKKESLRIVKDTLSTGMDSIRNSIHNIYDESLDIEAKINSLLNHFTFCKATLDYQIEHDLPMKAKYSMVYIVKEALSNIMKHSNANLVTISLYEHPAFYQLIICDNGTANKQSLQTENGIGLNNMTDRVLGLNGNFHIDSENGFRIFISIPKGDTKH